MNKLRKDTIAKFERNTLRVQLSTRGGGIEIDLTAYGFSGHKMTAYQNYLGGGMLGRVASDCTIRDFREHDKLSRIAERLRMYFHMLTNPEEDEWEHTSYEQNQSMPVSAY